LFLDYPAQLGASVTSPELDERYGRTPAVTRRRTVVAGAVAVTFAIALGAWVVWAGLAGQGASIEFRDLGHEIVDDSHVTVTWQVTADPQARLSCAVEALNSSYTVVGWEIIDLPPSDERTRTFSEELITSEPAVSGLIYRCWLA
jgi:hypothetical protein